MMEVVPDVEVFTWIIKHAEVADKTFNANFLVFGGKYEIVAACIVRLYRVYEVYICNGPFWSGIAGGVVAGVYGINSPKKMFEHLKWKVSIYRESPTDEHLTDVLFPLIHLREWVYPDGHKRLKKLPEQPRTREELLFGKLYEMHEFRMILSLFNKAKHFKDKGNTPVTSSVQNARAGLMRCGDRLNRIYHLVEGRDIREYFSAVIKMYKAYFDEISE